MDTEKTLICTKCHVEYPATLEFFKAEPKKKNGLSSNCRDCSNTRKREKYIEDRESGKFKEYYEKNVLTHKSSSLRQRGYPTITGKDLRLLIENFENKDGISICPYCGREIKDENFIHFDHFIPYSKDKNIDWQLINLIPVCKYCNRSKWNENFNEWYKEQFFYDPEKEQKLLEYLSVGLLIPFYL